jgi:hypothetical protein
MTVTMAPTWFHAIVRDDRIVCDGHGYTVTTASGETVEAGLHAWEAGADVRVVVGEPRAASRQKFGGRHA